jgi:ATP-binding cassette, subfamily C, bacterial CydD
VRPLDPRLLTYARASRGYVILTAGLGAVTAALVVMQALLLARVIAGTAMDGDTLADVRTSLFGIGLLVLARAVVAWAQDRYGHRAATTVIAQLRGQIAAHVAELGPSAVEGDRGPALATLTTRGLDALDGYLVRYLPQLLMTAIVTPSVLIVVWWQDAISGITILITIPLVPLFMVLVGWATQSAADRRLRTMQRLGSEVLDLIAGLPTLRALGREAGQGRQVRKVGDAYRRATMKTLRTAFLSALVLESLTTLSVALVAVGIGLRLVYGHLDLRTGLAILIMTPEVYLPLRMLGTHYHASVDGLAASSEAFAVLDREPPTPGTRPAPDLSRSTIVLDRVSVIHHGRDRATPKELSLTLEPGRILALAGSSGIGKSSAVLALLGLRRPEAGQIMLHPEGADPIDLAEVEPTSWFAQIAWAPQRPLLIPGSLQDNIRLGARSDDRDLDEVAALTGLDTVVADLPQGWDTRIGTGGHGLSAGQRQRLALSRAFLRRAPLVVLDEPTAHLDPATEQIVHATITRLRQEGRTILLVAHRPSLMAMADEVVTVRDGLAPATQGSPDEHTGSDGSATITEASR